MASATPGGAVGDPGGGDSGRGGGESSVGGSDSARVFYSSRGDGDLARPGPQSPRDGARSPESSAAAALARTVLASPAKTSNQWASSFGGIE